VDAVILQIGHKGKYQGRGRARTRRVIKPYDKRGSDRHYARFYKKNAREETYVYVGASVGEATPLSALKMRDVGAPSIT